MSDPNSTPVPEEIDPARITVKDDGQTEKYWDPAWGEQGAVPDGVSRLDPEGGEGEAD